MDDGFSPLHEVFKRCLNLQHPSIKYTSEKATTKQENGIATQSLNFLDIRVILNDNKIETDIYFRDTNSHGYLGYNGNHPQHVKDISCNLAKRIIVFTSNDKKS